MPVQVHPSWNTEENIHFLSLHIKEMVKNQTTSWKIKSVRIEINIAATSRSISEFLHISICSMPTQRVGIIIVTGLWD